ncbi:GxGYxYP domain-containing protein [Clostridium chromiireducens]
MNKKSKRFITWVILMTIAFSYIINVNVMAEMTNDNGVHLVLDGFNNNSILPKHFRKTTDLTVVKNNKDLILNGLDKLNISGSQQFSGNNIQLLTKAIDTSLPITVIDLRQECHGFINGFAVSWADAKNNANVGLTRDQVIAKEKEDLKSIKINEPITFYNNSKETMVVKTVQNEEELTKSKNLGYQRITVRDGGIPTDDMVDYFMEVIKNKPKDSWLHFHCKEGIGRTSTFMIMYDMINNYKEVSADGIIKRQLALANFEDVTLKSFYNNERIGFLNKFYDYCKANGDSFNTKWSKWESKSSSIDKADNSDTAQVMNMNPAYIKNNIIPKSLYVISLDSMLPSERTMITSLQGLVNNHCSFQIYTINSSQPDYKIWLEDLKSNYKVSYEIISDPWQLVSIYKDYINGYVLYSSKMPKDSSINNACSLASLNKALVIDETIEPKIKEMGIELKGDCRNTDECWAYNNLWNKGLNHSMVIELAPDRIDALRDYAIMTKSLIFYEKSIDKTVLRDKIFSSMEGDSTCLGWGPDEFINVSTASKHGVSMVAADWSYNLTSLSAFNKPHLTKKSSLTVPKEDKVHYVTFIMSDGDNQQWNLGTNYGSPKWFGYENRDKLALGWSITPALYYLTPTVFNLYYKSISNENQKNNFIVAPSGNGYIYPSKFPRNKLSVYVNSLNDYMKKVNENYVAIIDDSAFNDIELWDNFTKKSNIQGLFYLDYHRHDNYKGKILWSNNKPIVSCRDLLWDSLENEEDLVKKINDRVNSGQINVHNSEAYTFVYVHVWSKEAGNVEEVINMLRDNKSVRVVPPEVFMELIKKNVKPDKQEMGFARIY